jgi:hypothetical protein
LQRRDALLRGPHLGFRGTHDTRGLRRDGALQAADLPPQRQRVRMVRSEPSLVRLPLRFRLVELRAQLHHAGCDRCLRFGAGTAACRIQPSFRIRQLRLRVCQVFRQMADLFRLQPAVHALRKSMTVAVGGDVVLAGADLVTQRLGAFVEPAGGGGHGFAFRAVLILDVDIHRLVYRGGGQNRVFAGELHLDDARILHRVRIQRGAYRQQRVDPAVVHAGADDVGRRLGPQAQAPQHAMQQAGRAQGVVEFRVVKEVELVGDALGDMQAVQDFGLARHHCLGGRVGLQDALQLPALVLARLVHQRAGGGVGRGDPIDGDQRADRDQQRAGEEGVPPSPQHAQHGVDGELLVRAGTALALPGRRQGGHRSGGFVQHRRSRPHTCAGRSARPPGSVPPG